MSDVFCSIAQGGEISADCPGPVGAVRLVFGVLGGVGVEDDALLWERQEVGGWLSAQPQAKQRRRRGDAEDATRPSLPCRECV